MKYFYNYDGDNMRLWHQSLIKYLPNKQLLGQHRELCALRGLGFGRKHRIVDYVFEHPYYFLYQFHLIVFELPVIVLLLWFVDWALSSREIVNKHICCDEYETENHEVLDRHSKYQLFFDGTDFYVKDDRNSIKLKPCIEIHNCDMLYESLFPYPYRILDDDCDIPKINGN